MKIHRFLTRHGYDTVFLAIIILACLKITYNIMTGADIMFADESHYLNQGYGFQLKNFFKDGFVYFIWLKFLSFLIPDNLKLYCWNYGILIWVNPILLYILARRMKVGAITGAFFALFFLVSSFNIFTWPYITRFAFMIILLTALALVSVKQNETRYLTLLTGLVLLVYTRPEFFLSLIIFAVVSVVLLIYDTYKKYNKPFEKKRFKRIINKKNIYLIAGIIFVVVFISFVKSPVQRGRSIVAFGQHYAANLAEREKLNADPWIEWRRVMLDKFKTDQSLFNAFRNNPGEVVTHTTVNIKKFPKEFFYQMFPYHSGKMSTGTKIVIKWLIILLFLICFINAVRITFYRFRKRRTMGMKSTPQPGDGFFHSLLLLVFIPLCVSLFLIYPRTHYMLILFGLICIGMLKYFPKISILSGRRQEENKKYRTWILTGKAVLMVLVILSIYVLPWRASRTTGFLPGDPIPVCSYVTRVNAIKQIPVNTDVHLLSFFLNQDFQNKFLKMYLDNQSPYSYTIHHPAKGEALSFHQYLEEEKINMIFVNQSFTGTKTFSADESFKAFISQVESNNPGEWIRYPIPGCKEYLLVKKQNNQ